MSTLRGAAAILMSLQNYPGSPQAPSRRARADSFGYHSDSELEIDRKPKRGLKRRKLHLATNDNDAIDSSVWLPRARPGLRARPPRARPRDSGGSTSRSSSKRRRRSDSAARSSGKLLGRGPVRCRVCNAKFSSDSALYGHMRHCKPNKPTAKTGSHARASPRRRGSRTAQTAEHSTPDHMLLSAATKRSATTTIVFKLDQRVVARTRGNVRVRASKSSQPRAAPQLPAAASAAATSGPLFVRAPEAAFGCRHCGKSFGSKYALSGHYRHCMVRKSQNDAAFAVQPPDARDAAGKSFDAERKVAVGAMPRSNGARAGLRLDTPAQKLQFSITSKLGFAEPRVRTLTKGRFVVIRVSAQAGRSTEHPVPYWIGKTLGGASPETVDNARGMSIQVMGYKLSGLKTESVARWRCQHWTETVKLGLVMGVVERLPKEKEVTELGDFLAQKYGATRDGSDIENQGVAGAQCAQPV